MECILWSTLQDKQLVHFVVQLVKHVQVMQILVLLALMVCTKMEILAQIVIQFV
jgi:hypothetical protein